jgi:hypothetical protein
MIPLSPSTPAANYIGHVLMMAVASAIFISLLLMNLRGG